MVHKIDRSKLNMLERDLIEGLTDEQAQKIINTVNAITKHINDEEIIFRDVSGTPTILRLKKFGEHS
jgi:hypothetical protein